MEKLDLRKIIDESLENMVCESGNDRPRHLYEDYRMTFNEMRGIFKDIFSGKIKLTEKCDGAHVEVTYKDGGFRFAKNRRQLREPLKLERLGSYFDGNPKVREAYVNSANDLVKALNSIESNDLERLFHNGRKYASFDIVYPPCRNVIDYGNRCFLQLNGVKEYGDGCEVVSEDEDSSKWLYETLRNHKALKQEMFEIAEPNLLRMRDSVSAEKALNELMADFDRVIDGYSTKCTIQDYANERLRRCIINVCNHNDIEVDRDCQFVKELADRIGNFSGRRPTKSDICTFAKRCGVDVRSDGYRKLMETLDGQRDAINEEVMRPVENLVMKAGTLLFRNLTGFMSADPQKTSQKLVTELEHAIYEVEKDNSRLTSDKLKLFRRHVKKIGDWKDKCFPTEGIVFRHGQKVYRITGCFGSIGQILNILKY